MCSHPAHLICHCILLAAGQGAYIEIEEMLAYLDLQLQHEKSIHNGLSKNRRNLEPSRACSKDALRIGDAGTRDLLQVCLPYLCQSRDKNRSEEVASNLTRLPHLAVLEVFIPRTSDDPKSVRLTNKYVAHVLQSSA